MERPTNVIPAVPNAPQTARVGAMLRRFAEKPIAVERCELCSAELPPEHEHLVEVATRRLLCACNACAILFGYQAELKFRRVPRSIERLADFRLTDIAWSGLGIPIDLAFFFHSSPSNRVVAMYPSPAGPVESLLALDAWQEVVEDNPRLSEFEHDVEALLVNRVRRQAGQYYRAPLDECYKLAGLIRAHWRGLSGGTEVWKHIEQFFAALDERARVRTSPTTV